METIFEVYINDNSSLESVIYQSAILEVFIADDSFLESLLR